MTFQRNSLIDKCVELENLLIKKHETESILSTNELGEEKQNSILEENEKIKKELHELKVAKHSVHLELEDKIMSLETDLELEMKKNRDLIEERNCEINFSRGKFIIEVNMRDNVIKKLEEEKQTFITEIEKLEAMTVKYKNKITVLESTRITAGKEVELAQYTTGIDNNAHSSQDKSPVVRQNFQTQILVTEVKNQRSEIQSLKSIIEILQEERQQLERQINNKNNACLNCFPPVNASQLHWRTPNQKYNNNNTTRPHTETEWRIPCSNSFTTLSEEEDNKESSEKDCKLIKKNHNINKNGNSACNKVTKELKSITTTHKINIKNKKKILVLSDSHGRNLNDAIQQHTYCSVSTITRPNANLHQVIHDIHETTQHLTSEDFVIVIGGTNDVENGVQNIYKNLKDLITNVQHTNLIISTLSLRHDKPQLDERISRVNDFILDTISKSPSIGVLPLHDLPRDFYTNHGLHFNKRGKKKIGQMIVNLVRQHKTPSTELEVSPEQQRADKESRDDWSKTPLADVSPPEATSSPEQPPISTPTTPLSSQTSPSIQQTSSSKPMDLSITPSVSQLVISNNHDNSVNQKNLFPLKTVKNT